MQILGITLNISLYENNNIDLIKLGKSRYRIIV